MKKQDIIFGLTKVILDFIIAIASFFLAREIRLISDFIPGLNLQVQTIDTKNLIIYSFIAWVLLFIIFSIHWLYKIKAINSKIKEFFQIFLYWFYSFILFSVIVYFWIWFIFEIEIPRLITFFAFFITIFWIILERIWLNNLYYYLMNKKIISKSNLVLITNKEKSTIKYIIDDVKKAKIYKRIKYKNLDDLKKIIKNKEVDEIIYIDSNFNEEEKFELWELTRIFWVRYRYLTNSFDITKTNTELSLINKIPVLELKATPLNDWNIIIKRIFDIISSLIWIILFFPIFIIVYILIKIEDFKAPAIFKNKRVWRNWKIFNLYKFRYIKWKYCIKESYNVSKEEKQKALNYEKELIKNKSTRSWPLYKIKNDPRKTKIWTFIEKYSIDELPQFFNVLIWNMSLVWPRPHQPREVEKYFIHHKRLLTIKPWITGMAQVNWREENNFEDEAKLDVFYIENWNILLDLKIITKTFSSVIKRK